MKRVAAFIFALCPLLLEAQLEMTQVGTWANVKSFSVNDAEDDHGRRFGKHNARATL